MRLTVLLTALLAPLLTSATALAEIPDELLFKPGKEGFIASWLQLGTFAAPQGIKKQNARLAARDPLGIAGLEKPPRHGEVSVGKRWKARYSAAKHLEFGKPRFGTIYLSAVFRTPTAQKVWLSTGSDGGIEIWCNGKQLLQRNFKRRARPDTDLTALDLAAGDNIVVVKLWKADPKLWRFFARLMDDNFGLSNDVQIVLSGVTEMREDALRRTARLVLERELDLEKSGVDVTVGLVFGGGQPVCGKMNVEVGFVGPGAPEPATQVVDFSSAAASSIPLGKFRFDQEDIPQVVSVELGSLALKSHLGVRMSDLNGLAKATANLAAAAKKSGLPRTSLESATWRVEHLRSLLRAGDRDTKYLTREIRDTVAITQALAKGEDPYWGRKGEIQRRGYHSEIDGSYSPYALYVPPGWKEDGEQKFGLVVSLHGLNGGPMRNIQTVFGKPRDEEIEPQERERHPQPVGHSPFFVLSPHGFGNSGYRAFGEVDVLAAIAQVRERYRIDPNRMYITGFSMGGIGSTAIALRNPGVFAAAVPLCGYHSMFIYPSVRKNKLRSWEELLLGFNSNKDWALNGRYLPLHIVHGLRDQPMNSRVLVDKYNRYGYKVAYFTPDEGHDVWTETYENRWIFSHFRKYKRKTDPAHVAFRTSRLRYRSAYWIRLDDADDFGKWTQIDATWGKNNEITVKTDNVAAFTVHNVPALNGEDSIVLNIDGETIAGVNGQERWSFHRKDNKWTLGQKPECESLCKKPGLTGPVGDAFYGPLLFVYGTGDPDESVLARWRIKELGERWAGVTVKWPVKADKDVTPEDIENHSLVLVGTPTANSLLKKIGNQLPIRVHKGAVIAGNKRFKGNSVAASFIFPNPLNPQRYVIVHTGVSKEALYYIAHPPRLLPDYLIYDASEWGTKGGRVLGNDRDFLAGGFFDKYWQLPRL